MKKVLYVSYGGAHANSLRFVFHAVKKYKNIKQTVISLTVADKVFDRSLVPYKHMSDYLEFFKEKDDIINIGEELAKKVHNPKSGVSYDETVAYMGLGMWDLINRIGKKEAEKAFEKKERESFSPINVFRRIFDIEEPDILVVSVVERFEEAAAFVANERGIPVIRVATGHIILKAKYDCIICVMNENAKKRAINEGVAKEESFKVTGNPVLEDSVKPDYKLISETKRMFNCESFKNIVLFLPTNNQPENPKILVALDKMAQRNRETLFIVKTHPNEDKNRYADYIKNMIYLQEYPMNPLLHIADVAIITESTAGLEATMAGVPLINVIIDGHETCPGWDLSEYNIATKVNNLSELEDRIRMCLNNKSEVYLKLKKGREEFENIKDSANNIAKVIMDYLA